jgi:hypothetical protein
MDNNPVLNNILELYNSIYYKYPSKEEINNIEAIFLNNIDFIVKKLGNEYDDELFNEKYFLIIFYFFTVLYDERLMITERYINQCITVYEMIQNLRENIVYNLKMGFGKSTVIVPLLTFYFLFKC